MELMIDGRVGCCGEREGCKGVCDGGYEDFCGLRVDC